MRVSKLFGKTQREIPSEADTTSHQLLLRSGMVQQLTSGVYSYLPLAWRVLTKISNIVRDEMDKAGGQEVHLPILQPLELWQKTGRDQAFGDNLFRLSDRRDRPLVLGPTHEEVATDLASRFIQSYRDLPLKLYQIQTKLRDEARPRAGLMRVREFDMKDLYSFDVDEAGLEISYERLKEAYRNTYRRCGLPAIEVEADSGAIGGKASHEFMLLAESGEDEILHCRACGYAANAEKAQCYRAPLPEEAPLPMAEVFTPGKTSIEDITSLLGIDPCRMLKAVCYTADGQLIMLVLRGDIAVNEIKLKNALKANDVRLATDEELAAAGIITGFTSRWACPACGYWPTVRLPPAAISPPEPIKPTTI